MLEETIPGAANQARSLNPRGHDIQRIKRIQAAIVDEGERLQDKHPILKHQDALGTLACLTSCIGMIVMGILYVRGVVPWWATILVSGFFAGILNEVEHDLMHFLYFKDKLWAQSALMVLVWAFRGNYMNPWNRRKVHLHHHKTSGSKVDVETRMTGLGMGWSLLRVMLMIDTLWVLGISKGLARDAKGHYDSKETLRHMIPFTWIFFTMWVSLLAFQAFYLVNAAFHLGIVLTGPLAAYSSFLSIAWVVYLGPSILRTAALHIISSHTHYSGENLDLMRQTQSQGAWFLWPLQPFCFNFGKTHCIHHLVVQQPFYLRQMVAPLAYRVMRENGILFNDYGTFVRRQAYPGSIPSV
jgi:fatty acid desaturase